MKRFLHKLKKLLHEFLMLIVGLIGLGVFIVIMSYFYFVNQVGQKIFIFVMLFAVFHVSAELIIEWKEKRKKK